MKFIFKLLILSFIGIMSVHFAQASEYSSIEKYLDTFSRKIGLNGNVLITHDDKIILSKSYGMSDFKSKTPLVYKSQFHVGSVTKQFTAVAVLKLIQEKRISLKDKVSDLIPEFANTPWAQEVTIKHLLNHTSGIYEPNPLEGEHKPHFSEVGEVITYLKDKPSISQPGKLFLYSNNGYLVLGYIIEKIAQKSLAQYLKDTFFEPLQMNSTNLCSDHQKSSAPSLALPHIYKDGGAIDSVDKYYVDFPFSAGGLISTTEDLWKWNKALYNGHIINESLLQDFVTPNLLGYGLGITIETFANGDVIYKHGGAIDGYHSLLIYLPKQKVTICVLTNVDYPSPHRMEALMSNLTMMIE